MAWRNCLSFLWDLTWLGFFPVLFVCWTFQANTKLVNIRALLVNAEVGRPTTVVTPHGRSVTIFFQVRPRLQMFSFNIVAHDMASKRQNPNEQNSWTNKWTSKDMVLIHMPPQKARHLAVAVVSSPMWRWIPSSFDPSLTFCSHMNHELRGSPNFLVDVQLMCFPFFFPRLGPLWSTSFSALIFSWFLCPGPQLLEKSSSSSPRRDARTELYRLGKSIGSGQARRHMRKGWTILQALTISLEPRLSSQMVIFSLPKNSCLFFLDKQSSPMSDCIEIWNKSAGHSVGGVAVIAGYCWEFNLRDGVRSTFEKVAADQLQEWQSILDISW